MLSDDRCIPRDEGRLGRALMWGSSSAFLSLDDASRFVACRQSFCVACEIASCVSGADSRSSTSQRRRSSGQSRHGWPWTRFVPFKLPSDPLAATLTHSYFPPQTSSRICSIHFSFVLAPQQKSLSHRRWSSTFPSYHPPRARTTTPHVASIDTPPPHKLSPSSVSHPSSSTFSPDAPGRSKSLKSRNTSMRDRSRRG